MSVPGPRCALPRVPEKPCCAFRVHLRTWNELHDFGHLCRVHRKDVGGWGYNYEATQHLEVSGGTPREFGLVEAARRADLVPRAEVGPAAPRVWEVLVDISVRHLGLLEVLRVEGSFRRAAIRLGVGQPALSRQITRLEKALEVTLLERSVDGVVLTAAGHVVVKYAGRVTEALDDMVWELRELTGAPLDGLRVAASLNPLLTTRYLLDRGLQVHVSRAQDAAALALVETGTADVALVVDDPVVHYRPKPGLRSAVVLETPLWVAVGTGHALAGHDVVRLADLDREQWVVPSGGVLRTIIGALWRNAGIAPRVRLSGDMESLLPEIEVGSCVGLASPLCGAFYGRRFEMRALVEAPVERKICVWREDAVAESLVRSLIAEHQRRHVELAPVVPEYQAWLERTPWAMPAFRG